MEHYFNEETRNCINTCWGCRSHCQETLFNYCLKKGGEHSEIDHVKTMIDCVEICQIAADAMTRQSDNFKAMCRVCAEICEACAQKCSKIDDEKMKECSEICLDCAKTCQEMAH